MAGSEQTERQKDRKTERQKDRKTERQKNKLIKVVCNRHRLMDCLCQAISDYNN